ncbi:MAG: iron export ABC transporter permease subunit FetB [Hyphomicrobiaceae bacterium]|nr:iron export ABC transporter permease subunit FetB [Hyphomicrobiaceae bacterium]
MNYISLSYWDLALASVLILANGMISIWFRLGLEKTLLINTTRMLVQLSLIGFVLKFIFVQTSPWWTIGLALIMVAVAGREVAARLTTRLKGWWSYGIGTTTMFFISISTTLLAVAFVISPDPWFAPRYVLPLLGMVLGNTLSGISLGLETLITTLKRERVSIEARIALGHKRFEAIEQPVRQALKTGMMPIINAMAASGVVSLPGMMTGQIMAGADPVEATKYQILIMFLIGGATASGTLLAVLGSAWRLSDERGRLRLDRLE